MIDSLSRFKVLDLSATVSGSFAASLLADHGACVHTTSNAVHELSQLAPESVRASWTTSIIRNKKLIDSDDARAIADAYRDCDVLIASGLANDFIPPEGDCQLTDQAPARPSVRIFLFDSGADIPTTWTGTQSAAAVYATSGLAALTGQPDAEPILPEAPIAESLTGTMAALCVVAELWAGRNKHRTTDIELAGHETIQRMIEWQVPVASLHGTPELRCGNSFPLNAGISNTHLTSDGKYIAISAANQTIALRLLRLVGGDALANDARYANESARREHMNELYIVIDKWMARRTADEVLELTAAADVVAGLIYDQHGIVNHEHVSARLNLASDSTGMKTVRPVPRISEVI